MLANRSTALQLPLFSARDENGAWAVRVSARARRLSVRVYPAGRVEVVVPKHTPVSRVEDFVSRHRQWIETRLRECAALPRWTTPPDVLLLPALERTVQISMSSGRGSLRLRELDQHHLELRGDATDMRQWSRLLTRWLTTQADLEFAPRLQQVALQTGLAYQRLQVRRQRTRWGSCSSRGTISLNLCGLFVRPEVLRYLMIHELCHTEHMNHSTRFWTLVAQHEPEYRTLDRELTRGWQFVPSWLFVN